MAKTANVDVQAKLDEIAVKKAEMELKLVEAQLAQFEAKEAEHARAKQQTQQQLAAETAVKTQKQAECHHRAGAPCRKPLKGSREFVLRRIRMPDGFTKIIHCPICRLQVRSPHPADGFTEARPGETAAQLQARLMRFAEESALYKKFEVLFESMELGADGADLDTGTEVTFEDARGNRVYPRRSWDLAA